MQGRILFTGFVALALAGCQKAEPATVPAKPTIAPLGQQFDPHATGAIAGRVLWQGPKLSVPPLRVHRHVDMLPMIKKPEDRPNPFAPAIGPDLGLANAVVFLERVDLTRSRAWDHAPARLEFQDGSPERLVSLQGESVGRVGIVRLHDAIQAVNRQKIPQMLRAQEGSYFTLPLIDPDIPTTRALHEPGPIEFCSAAGYYWMRAHLFVTEHPYAAVTAADGSYALPQVPEGKYRLLCWHPNWNIDRHERDPELHVKVRLYFKPAEMQEQTVTVRRGQTTPADFAVR